MTIKYHERLCNNTNVNVCDAIRINTSIVVMIGDGNMHSDVCPHTIELAIYGTIEADHIHLGSLTLGSRAGFFPASVNVPATGPLDCAAAPPSPKAPTI